MALKIPSQTNRFFLSFWTICTLLQPNRKCQDFQKFKKSTGNIVILHMFTINDNHMIHVF